MIGLEDRQTMVQHINTAHTAGARLRPACELAGISVRTFERWQANDGLALGDRRPEATRSLPAHALTAAERARILAVANEPRFADQPPARIVPALADDGVLSPANQASSACCAPTGRMPTEAAAGRHSHPGRRPHTLPPLPARCGAGI